MKVAANGSLRVAARCASSSRRSFLTRSILLSTRTSAALRVLAAWRGCARDLLVEPLGGIDQQHHDVGVACPAPGGLHHGPVEPPARREDAGRIDEHELARRPRWRCRARGMRVVCTLWLTIETLAPTSALTSVDLPALGAPMTAMKPQRVARPRPSGSLIWRRRHTPSRASSAVAAACSAARLLAPSPRAGLRALDAHLGGEARRVVGALAGDLDVVRQVEALALRPLLQRRLGIGRLGRASPRAWRPSARAPPRAPCRSRPRGRWRRAAPRRRRPGSSPCRARRCRLPTRSAPATAPRSSARATSAQVPPRTRRL